MRSFIIGLSLLMLGLSPSLASGPCAQVINPAGKSITYNARGYEPVVVLIEVPVADDFEEEAKKALFQIRIDGRNPQVRPDFKALDSVFQCAFVIKDLGKTIPDDKMLIRVRADVQWEMNTKETFFLRTVVMLPQSLLKKKPKVESELDSGALLRGEWQKLTASVPVVKKGKKGKPFVVYVNKTYTQIALRP